MRSSRKTCVRRSVGRGGSRSSRNGYPHGRSQEGWFRSARASQPGAPAVCACVTDKESLSFLFFFFVYFHIVPRLGVLIGSCALFDLGRDPGYEINSPRSRAQIVQTENRDSSRRNKKSQIRIFLNLSSRAESRRFTVLRSRQRG